MKRSVIDNDELFRLVKQRKTVSEIARILGVKPPAVSKRLKKLNVAIAKDVALRSAPELVDKSIQAMDQLNRINALINKELDHIQEEIAGKTGAERQPMQEARLKHVAEIRKQLSLLLEIQITCENLVQIRGFQDSVLGFIDTLEPGLRDRFYKWLADEKMISSPVCLPGGISRMKENVSF